MRQIVLDTETTGLEPAEGHRVIEIGCVELIDRKLTGNRYHQYIQPDRQVDDGALEVHGISNDFLADKPRFAEIYADFVNFVRGAQLIIHNAPFDVGFLNHEFRLYDQGATPVDELCQVIDTLKLARERHPGQKNNLDALCKRYEVDNTHRDLHGALLDAEILADVYLKMTGGQVALSLDGESTENDSVGFSTAVRRVTGERPALKVIRAQGSELEAHAKRLADIEKASGVAMSWPD